MKFFESLGYKFDLKMDESERIELQKIDTALQTALASNGCQLAWDNAYCLARSYDTAFQTLSTNKLRDNLFPREYLEKVVLLSKYVNRAHILLSVLILLAMFTTDDKVAITKRVLHLYLMMTSINALSELIATVYESQMPFITKLLTTTFVPHSATNAILSAAADAGVELNKLNLTSGEMLKDSNSLISLLINNVSHSNQREKITDLDIPDEYICPITRNVMIDPVYSDHNPQRVERTAVLYWLQKRNIHPYTSCPLFEDDLKRDFKLKLKIDIFLEDKSQKNSTKGSNQTLIGLSIFKPQTQCFQEETMVDDITDQMMAESAFGKGSHTYKNRLANMVGENQSKLT